MSVSFILSSLRREGIVLIKFGQEPSNLASLAQGKHIVQWGGGGTFGVIIATPCEDLETKVVQTLASHYEKFSYQIVS